MYINPNNHEELTNILSAQKLKKKDVFCLYIAEKNSLNLDLLFKGLNERNIPFMGGVFPAVINEDKKYEEGIVISILENVDSIHIVEGLDSNTIEIPDFHLDGEKKYCALTYVDGLSQNIALFLNNLYDTYGSKISYLGGGAGSLSFVQKPCVFSNEGFFEGAALITLIETSTALGVSHGWDRVKGPLVVTKSNKNVIEEINWQPAFAVYKDLVEEDSGQEIRMDNFFDISKGYPFGMHKDYAEQVVRDPIAVNEGNALICVGEVPENTVMDLLRGDNNHLILAAEKATQECCNYDLKQYNNCIIVDCISRAIFMEDEFEKELQMVGASLKNKFTNVEISGALTLGEISSYGNGYLEFFNKTIVIGLLYE